MNVSLTPELAKFVEGKVESGMHNNASEVVREGLRLLKEHDDIRRKYPAQVEHGSQQAEAAEVVGSRTTMAEIRRLKARTKQRA